MAPVLEVDGLRVEFAADEGAGAGGRRRVVLARRRVRRVAVVGESGSGKTVTALAIMGLIDAPGRITEGDVRLDGRSLAGLSEDEYRQVRGRDVAMVFQDPMTALNPAQRVGAQVAEAITVHDRRSRVRRRRARAIELLGRGGDPVGRAARAATIRTSSRAGCASG